MSVHYQQPGRTSKLSSIWRRLWQTMRPRLHSRTAEVTVICRRAAAGDLEARITGMGTRTNFGKMCQAINEAFDMSDSFVREAAAAMENCSRDRFHRPILLRGLKGAYQQSAGIINAAGLKMKEHNDNIVFVQKQAAENAQNVCRVAAACEELSATTTEISGQTNDAANTAREAVAGIAQITATLQELTAAVAKISGVVQVINNVAMQTNLLALNASIEAAHAGEQGAGFAVVASEVKSLATETHKATDEIGAEMQQMQVTVAQVTSLIAKIKTTIEGVHETASSIAISVREQVQATTEISNTITEVSKNSEEVSLRISQAKEDTGESAVSAEVAVDEPAAA